MEAQHSFIFDSSIVHGGGLVTNDFFSRANINSFMIRGLYVNDFLLISMA